MKQNCKHNYNCHLIFVPISGIDALQKLYCTDWSPFVLARSLGLVATNSVTPLKKIIMSHAG